LHGRLNLFAASVFSRRQHDPSAEAITELTLLGRSIDDLDPVPSTGTESGWAGDVRQDTQGRKWTLLKLRDLLADPAFLDVGS
jgi:hypothetical protein